MLFLLPRRRSADERGGELRLGEGQHVAALDQLDRGAVYLARRALAVELRVEQIVAGCVEDADRDREGGVALDHALQLALEIDEVGGGSVEIAWPHGEEAAALGS